MRIIAFFFLLSLFFLACKKQTGRNVNKIAQYSVDIVLNWDSIRYPVDYPFNPHFSPFIGWSHNDTSSFFKENTLASIGIESMAETGGVNSLTDEIKARIANKEGLRLYKGNGLSKGTGVIKLDIEVNNDNPSVTLVSMIAPSPDWYVGIININLLKNDQFVEEKTVNFVVYDAGTDNGITYASANDDTNPKGLISLLASPPLGDGRIVNPAVGKVRFYKQ